MLPVIKEGSVGDTSAFDHLWTGHSPLEEGGKRWQDKEERTRETRRKTKIGWGHTCTVGVWGLADDILCVLLVWSIDRSRTLETDTGVVLLSCSPGRSGSILGLETYFSNKSLKWYFPINFIFSAHHQYLLSLFFFLIYDSQWQFKPPWIFEKKTLLPKIASCYVFKRTVSVFVWIEK